MKRSTLIRRLEAFARMHERKAEWCRKDGLPTKFWNGKARLIREAIDQLKPNISVSHERSELAPRTVSDFSSEDK